MKRKIMWAVKCGEPDWKECIITELESQFADARLWCKQHDYDRIRIAEINIGTPPDFVDTIKK